MSSHHPNIRNSSDSQVNESSSSEKFYKNVDEDPPKKSHKKKTSSVLKGYYVIEKILDKKKDEKGWKYKIKWKDYPMTQCIKWTFCIFLYLF